MCEDCYLKFSNNFEYVQDPKAIMKEFESFNPKGTGGLRPEIIDRRRLVNKKIKSSILYLHYIRLQKLLGRLRALSLALC